jgi:polar amino acid transport system substrate-binding protein
VKRFVALSAAIAVTVGAGLAMVAAPLQAGELPEAIKQSKTLHLSINATYPPLDFKDPDTGKITGFDVDLAEALAAKLGLKIEWTDVPFAQLIPSLTTARTDFIWSAITDLPARRETMDFIDYIQTGPQFYTLSTAPYQTPEDLCGKKVGSIRSTQYPDQMRAWSAEHCEKAGKPAMEVVAGENSPDVRTQLKQGRIDGAVQGAETIPYISKQEGGVFKLLGTPFIGGLYYGIAFRKEDKAFRDLIADTLDGLIKDSTYKKTLEKWELTAIGVGQLTINTQPR